MFTQEAISLREVSSYPFEENNLNPCSRMLCLVSSPFFNFSPQFTNDQDTSLSPTIQTTIPPTNANFFILFGSLKMNIPSKTLPDAPIPVHKP